MAKQTVNVGGAISDPAADTTRDAFIKVNNNFDELYNVISSSTNLTQDVTHNRANILMSGNGLTYTFVNLLAIEVGAPFKITVNGTGFSFDDAAVNVTYPQALQDVSGSAYTITKTGTTTGTDNYIVTQEGSAVGASSSVVQRTGATMNFDTDAVYNDTTPLTSGDLTLDGLSAAYGKVNINHFIGHIPNILLSNFGSKEYRISGKEPSATGMNIYSVMNLAYLDVKVDVKEKLLAPSLILTPRDEEITVNWGAILNADNYVIERALDSGFTSGLTEIYNGSLLTFLDTGLTNGTTYYYRGKAQGAGYIESDFSATASAAPSDSALLADWNPADDASVTTANGSVSSFLDQTANNHDLSESTLNPTHSSANDVVIYSATSSGDRLKGTFADLNFQQSDDFSIVVLGLKLNPASAGGVAINNKLAGANGGYAIQYSADNTNLFFQIRDASTANTVTYNIPAGHDDSVARNYIMVNSGNTLTAYDGANASLGSSSTVLGTIDYTSVEFLMGQASNGTLLLDGEIGRVKVFNKALDATERANELGI